MFNKYKEKYGKYIGDQEINEAMILFDEEKFVIKFLDYLVDVEKFVRGENDEKSNKRN